MRPGTLKMVLMMTPMTVLMITLIEIRGSLSTCVNKYLGAAAAHRRFPGPADHKIFIATNTNICPHTDYTKQKFVKSVCFGSNEKVNLS